MKRFPLVKFVLLYVLLFCGFAHGASGVLFQTGARSKDTGLTAQTPNVNALGCNLITISVAWYSANTITISDSSGNTYTGRTKGTNGSFNARIYDCYAPTVTGSMWFKIVGDGGSNVYPAIQVVGVNGAVASPFDQENGNSSASATTLTTGSITPSQANELVVWAVSAGVTGNVVSDTSLQQFSTMNQSGQALGGGMALLHQGVAAAINPTWTMSGGASTIVTRIASYKLGAAAAGNTSGTVQFVGKTISSSGDVDGFPAYNAFDGDLTSIAAATGANGSISVDMGGAVNVTAMELTSQISTASGTEEQRLCGALIQSDSSLAFGAPTTIYTVASLPTAVPFFFPNIRTRQALSGSPAQCYRVKATTLSLAEMAFFGPTAAVPKRPSRVSISPYGGNAAGGKLVTMTCATTSASIYYTADGSAPGINGTLYTGPFTQTGTGTIRAIAYDPTCEVAYSVEGNTAHFRNYEFAPNDTWYDSNGDIVESHNPSICEYPVGSGNYRMFCTSANTGYNGNDTNGRYGINMYTARLTATGFTPWVPAGNIVMTSNGSTYYETRPDGKVCPSSGALSLWSHTGGFTGAQKVAVYECTAADPTIPANWTSFGEFLPDSQTSVGDLSRCTFNGDCYLLYSYNNLSNVGISKLAANYRSTTNTDFLSLPGSAGESPVGFQYGNKLWIGHSTVTNYYDSTKTYAQKFRSTTAPLTSGAYSSETFEFAVDPVGGNFNGQNAAIFVVAGKVAPAIMWQGDYWQGGNGTSGVSSEYPSRSVWLPIDMSSGTPVISVPATWDFTTFTNLPVGGGAPNKVNLGVGMGISRANNADVAGRMGYASAARKALNLEQ